MSSRPWWSTIECLLGPLALKPLGRSSLVRFLDMDNPHSEATGTAMPVLSAEWCLLRAAVISVADPPEEFRLTLSDGDAEATTYVLLRDDQGRPIGMGAVAVVPLAGPPTQTERGVAVPGRERKAAEDLLRMLARFVALDRRAAHSVASMSTCVGFFSSEGNMSALEGVPAIVAENNVRSWPAARAGLLGGELQLLDAKRTDGVVLLTEVLNARSPLGQFGQLWRFFERAFKKDHWDAAKKLESFLAGASHHHFEESEIDSWAQARNRATHPNNKSRDNKSRDDFRLDSDVQPYIGRMLEAAYDVLLNKKEWWSSSVERRNVWTPVTGSSGPSDGTFVAGRVEEGGALHSQLLDYFAVVRRHAG